MVDVSISNEAAIAACDAVVDKCDQGTGVASAHLLIYSGTPPANVDAALSGNTLLAELVMSNPAFGAAADAAPGATATAASITSDSAADATGTASFFRIVDRDSTPQIQGTVTATGGGGVLELNTVSIVAGVIVAVSSLTITVPEA